MIRKLCYWMNRIQDLDQGAISILNNVVLSMKEKGCTTLMVTHDFKQAAEICDRIIM